MTREDVSKTIESIDLMRLGSLGYCAAVKMAAFNASTALKALEIELIKQDMEISNARIARLAEEIERRELQQRK